MKALEVIEEEVEMINNKKSPIVDKEIEKSLANKELNLEVTTNKTAAYGHDFEYVIIAALINYDDENDCFDTSLVEIVIENVLEFAPEAVIIIKSTVPVGYRSSIREKYNTD